MTSAVVVPRWGDGAEEERFVAPLLRFLGVRGGVEVLACEASGHADALDQGVSLLELHRPSTLAARSIARRAIGAAATEAGMARGWLPEPARRILLGHLEQSWNAVRAHVHATRPSTVVVCGDCVGSALSLFHSVGDDACRVAFPLSGHHRTPLGPDAVAACRAADVRLAVNNSERAWLECATEVSWSVVGTSIELPEVESADVEDLLVPDGHVAVVDDLCAGVSWREPTDGFDDDRAVVRAGAWLTAVVPCPVVALASGDVVQWSGGKPQRRAISPRARDSVIGSARVVVAADRDSSFASGVLVSLALGRPVVVLDGAPGAAYVAESQGGVVVRGLAEVMHGVRELLDDPTRAEVVGKAGAEWAYAHAVSDEAFAARLLAAGISPEPS